MVRKPLDGDGLFEASRSPSPPSIAVNTLISDHDLAEPSPQDSQAAAEEGPVISLPGEAVGPEDHAHLPLNDEDYVIVSHQQPEGPCESLANNTLRDDRLMPFASLSVDPSFGGERPPIERSSSLEVHASSPAPSDKDLSEDPILPFDEDCEETQGFGMDGTVSSFRQQRSFTSHSCPPGYAGPMREPDNHLLLTPQTSYAASCPSPMYSEAQRMNSAMGFTPSPHLTTIEEGFDCHFSLPGPVQAPVPAPYNHNPAYGNFGMPNNSAAYPIPAQTNYVAEEPQPPHRDGPKYPPCWTTPDKLLIVPSVPGELPEERAKMRSKNGYATRPKRDDTLDDQSTVAALSPNVTAYRKGRYSRRKRYSNHRQNAN